MVSATDAILKLEKLFQVHHEVGQPIDWTDQDDKVLGSEQRDPTLAPNGVPYVTVSSYGVDMDPATGPVLFRSERIAMSWWYDEVLDYAASVDSDKENWSRLHFYWCQKPEFYSADWLIMDQAHVLQTQSPLGAILTAELGFVQGRLLISKLDPNGKEA